MASHVGRFLMVGKRAVSNTVITLAMINFA